MGILSRWGKKDALRTCWDILPGVSRSFSIPIRMLPRPLDDAVMLSYLIFRIADTIEDSCPESRRQKHLFVRFRNLLDGDASAAGELATIAPPPYDYLMTHTGAVAEAFGTLPDNARKVILDSLDEMSGGMQEWSQREVRTLSDLHSYCYYVAGIVGKMLTGLFLAYRIVDEATYQKLMERAVDFGIALQMINIIRDVREDDREGRHYWPTNLMNRYGLSWEDIFDAGKRDDASRLLEDLIGDALEHCDAAYEYIRLLPRRQVGSRLFCAIPLYMAVWTLRRCLRNPELFASDRPVKIGRRKTKHILALCILLAPGNRLLGSWYRRLRRRFMIPVPQMS